VRKKFQYTIRLWKDVEISANDLDEAFQRAELANLDHITAEIIAIVRTGIPECELDKNAINSNN
jgi:hypothetical protein